MGNVLKDLYLGQRLHLLAKTIVQYGGWERERKRGGHGGRSSPTSPIAKAFNCAFVRAWF